MASIVRQDAPPQRGSTPKGKGRYNAVQHTTCGLDLAMPDIKIFDLHCDTIDALAFGDAGPFIGFPSTEGDLAHNQLALATDRMRQLGPWCQCYAIWIPDKLKDVSPLELYRRGRDYLQAQVREHADELAQVRNAREIDELLAQGKVAALLTVENGSPAGTDLGIVDEWAADGVKMVTLTWNDKNSIASGNDTAEGLSPFGRQLVRALEERKIVVDVSHLNDVGFWELVKLARRPLVASHSNLRSVCKHPRNLTDDQFRAIRDSGGIVGLNYYTDFLLDDGQARGSVSFDDLSRHLERFLSLDGERVVALGSDFDGCTPPAWLDSCEKLAPFAERISQRFGEELSKRLFFENAHDFFVRNESA